MPVLSTPFGPVTVTGDEARDFSRKVQFGRGTAAAAEAAASGRRMMVRFAGGGVVAIELTPKDSIPTSSIRTRAPST